MRGDCGFVDLLSHLASALRVLGARRGHRTRRRQLPFPQRRNCRRLCWNLKRMDDHFALEGARVLQTSVIPQGFLVSENNNAPPKRLTFSCSRLDDLYRTDISDCAGCVRFTPESAHQALSFKMPAKGHIGHFDYSWECRLTPKAVVVSAAASLAAVSMASTIPPKQFDPLSAITRVGEQHVRQI